MAVLSLRYSNDGGATWSVKRDATIPDPPSAGRVIYWRMGSGRNRVFEISTVDPVPFVIVTAVMEGDVGNA